MKVTLFVLFLLLASFAVAAEKPPYEVGTFMSSRQVSDGTYSTASCGSFGCNGSAYNAAHNVHLVSTPDGIFSIEAPVSVAGTILLGMVSNGNSPTLHKAWFMDDLHEGDKVLFSAQCGKHGRCTIRLPDPDKPNKEIRTLGFFFPAIAKTNTTTLCGTGKLTADVEAQVCTQRNPPPPSAAPSSPSRRAQKPVLAASSREPLNLHETVSVAVKQKSSDISATPESPLPLSPETPTTDQANTRQKPINRRVASAEPEESMSNRYWGMPEKPITSALSPQERTFIPVGSVKQYRNGKRFDREFFAATYGRMHVFRIDSPAILWKATPFKMNSSFCQGGFCFMLFDSIPSYWFYYGSANTFIDETCIDDVDSGDSTCTYFLYDADNLAQRVMIFVLEP